MSSDEFSKPTTFDSTPEGRFLRTVRFIVSLPGRFLIGCVRLYQMTLSPILGANCRFVPSCSEYFIQAVKKYGAVSGAVRGMLRICRCHPFHKGGYDPP